MKRDSLLEDMRQPRRPGDAAATVKRIAETEGDGEAFTKLMCLLADHMSGSTFASKPRTFETQPVSQQTKQRVRDVDTRWGVFRLSRPDWRSLFMAYPAVGIPALFYDSHITITKEAPWLADEQEEVLYPIRRYLQVWWAAKDAGWNTFFARKLVVLWYYSRITALDILKRSIPESLAIQTALWKALVEKELQQKLSWLDKNA